MDSSAFVLRVGHIVAIACVVLSSGCGQRSRAPSAQGAMRDTIVASAVTEESVIYAAALDSLIAERSALWGADGPETVYVLATIHWWPMVDLDGTQSTAIGPTPIPLRAIAKELGSDVATVSFREAVAEDGRLLIGSPLIVLGPIDYIERDQALLRASLYTGRNGQELYRVELVRTGTEWKTVSLRIELQS